MEQQLRQQVAAGIHLVSEGIERYRVFTPFQLDDGDHLSIVLKKEGGDWFFSDEGHTYMHLSYDIDSFVQCLLKISYVSFLNRETRSAP